MFYSWIRCVRKSVYKIRYFVKYPVFLVGLLCSLRGRADTIEYVIAHYQENIDWVKPYASQSSIYHKGKKKKPAFPSYRWKKLKNVGREGHTYLYHIVNNYRQLADITVFLQGRIDDHSWGKTPEDIVQEAREKGIGCLGVPLWVGTHVDYPGLEAFWEEMLGAPLLPGTIFYTNGCFAVRKDLIQSHPEELYRNLLSRLSRENNPPEGFYLERMWYFLFAPEKATHFYPENK